MLYQLTCALTVIRRREVSKDVELLMLRHENAVLRRQINRMRYRTADRIWLAVLARWIPVVAGQRCSPSLLRQCWRGITAWWPAHGTELLRWRHNQDQESRRVIQLAA